MSTEIAVRAAALAILRKKFEPENIAKLPKVNCYQCTQANRQQRNTTCNQHRMAKCRECDAYITTGHIHLDYVGHAEATNRLLDADPEWTWEPLALDANGLPAFDKDDGLWIRLTVAGVTRLGYGSADGKRGPNAIKECIGDAIRNAGMRFGMALDLWAKTDLHADEHEEPEAEQSQDRPAERHRGRVDDEWNTATGQPLAPPAPTVQFVTGEQLGEIDRLLRVKRNAVNGARQGIIEQLVNRPVPEPQKLSAAEGRSIIETLSAEDDWTPPAEAAPAGPAPVGTPDNPAITAPQQKALHAVLNKAGYGNRAKGLELLGRYVGRPLESSEHLSKTEASSIIDKLSNGELPPPVDAPSPGPNANGEGINEFDALDQMILDVTSQEAHDEVQQAITVEVGRGTITATGAGVLRRRLAEHVAQLKAGAVS